MAINWYPGHMAKAKREMADSLSLVDVVIEVVDARAPEATRNPDIDKLAQNKPRVVVLNKSDLANDGITKQWVAYYTRQGFTTIAFCAMQNGGKAALEKAIGQAAMPVLEKWKSKGVRKTIRVLIAGIPNVGKSSIINRLSGGARAKTGAKPGVTRGRQWVKIGTHLELMDTPGILWPKLEDAQGARHLAYINAIRDEVLDGYELALSLADELMHMAPDVFSVRYGFDCQGMAPIEVLGAIAKRRGYVIKGGTFDEERAGKLLLEEFRAGKLGAVSLECPKEAL